MAAKRVAMTTVDWAALGQKIQPAQKEAFNMLKMRADGHARRVVSLPDALPKIDFAAYRGKVTVPGMVENFEKQYTGLSIAYPGDQGKLAEIDAQAAQQKAAVEAFVADSNIKIDGIKTELAKWEAMMPIEEMNLEEALDNGLGGILCVDPDVASFCPHDRTWEEYKETLLAMSPEELEGDH